jgi:iron-regulated transporter 1
LRRTDLFTELVGALAFGAIYSRGGLPASMAFTAALALAAAPLQLLFIRRIAHAAPAAMLHGRQELGAGWARVPSWRTFVQNARQRRVHAAAAAAQRQPLPQRLRRHLAHALDGWRSYFRAPILPASLTFVLLFFNVVLSPGGLITALLTQWGVNGEAMAVFRGGCASESFGAPAGCTRPLEEVQPKRASQLVIVRLLCVLFVPAVLPSSSPLCAPTPGPAACGFLGTLIGKRLIQTLGLLRAGSAALLIQASLLGAATVLYATLLTGPPELGAAGLGAGAALLAGAGVASWPVLGGVPLPVAVFAGKAAPSFPLGI